MFEYVIYDAYTIYISVCLLQFVLLGYCMSYGDIYRIVNGYDDCGNVCGRENQFFNENTGCKVSTA